MQKFQIQSIDKANLTLSLLQIWNHCAFPNKLYKQLNRGMNCTSFCSGSHIHQLIILPVETQYLHILMDTYVIEWIWRIQLVQHVKWLMVHAIGLAKSL